MTTVLILACALFAGDDADKLTKIKMTRVGGLAGFNQVVTIEGNVISMKDLRQKKLKQRLLTKDEKKKLAEKVKLLLAVKLESGYPSAVFDGIKTTIVIGTVRKIVKTEYTTGNRKAPKELHDLLKYIKNKLCSFREKK